MLYGECGPWPCLTVKAHSGKIFLIYLGGCLRDLLSRKPDDREIKLASWCVDSLLRWFHLVETSPKRFLSDAQAQGIADAGYSFLRLIMALANHGASLSIFRWKLLPKHHAYAHLLEDSLHRKENPRAYHCFQDEDMIGRWKKLCHGTQGSLMEYRLMARYLLRMGATAKR